MRRGRDGSWKFQISRLRLRHLELPTPITPKAVVARVYDTSHVFFIGYRIVYSSLGFWSTARFYRLGRAGQLLVVADLPSQVGARLGALTGTGSCRR